MSQKLCSVVRDVTVVPADRRAWRLLAAFHYRGGAPATADKVFALVRPIAKPLTNVRGQAHDDTRGSDRRDAQQRTGRSTPDYHPGLTPYEGMDLLGVIIYSQPVRNCAMRNAATNRRYVGLGDAAYAGQLLQHEMRTISRVVIHPRWRGVGLGTRLVRETLPLAGTALVEAIAAMGAIHPFFEKAGMSAYPGQRPAHAQRFLAACEQVGIDEDTLACTQTLARRVEQLASGRRRFFEHELKRFAGVYNVTRASCPRSCRDAGILLGKSNRGQDVHVTCNRGQDVRVTTAKPLYNLARRALQRPAYYLWGLPW